MAKIYTRSGDAGETSLFGGRRVRKDDLRVEAIGTVDELNGILGVVRAKLACADPAPAEIMPLLLRLQHQLFELGAELADPRSDTVTRRIGDQHVAGLEAAIDQHEVRLQPLQQFILPGGSAAAADLHVARSICRRAERRLVALAAREPVGGDLVRYLNRLSDLLFVLARSVNQMAGVPDVPWQQDR